MTPKPPLYCQNCKRSMIFRHKTWTVSMQQHICRKCLRTYTAGIRTGQQNPIWAGIIPAPKEEQ